MGFFKKLLLEEVPEEQLTYETNACEEIVKEVEMVNVNTENVTQENLIVDIYNQNNKADTSRSIFKIEELINSLPKEMPNETKKTTVMSMLSIFGLTIEEVQKDGMERYAMLTSALLDITDENNNVIHSNNELIEQKKLEIQELEKDNAERSLVIRDTEDKITTESNKIKSLIKFIGGEV